MSNLTLNQRLPYLKVSIIQYYVIFRNYLEIYIQSFYISYLIRISKIKNKFTYSYKLKTFSTKNYVKYLDKENKTDFTNDNHIFNINVQISNYKLDFLCVNQTTNQRSKEIIK